MPSATPRQVVVRQTPVPGVGHGRDDGQIRRAQVGAAGRGVVVGGVDERLDGDRDGRPAVRSGAPQLLQRAAGEHRAGADRVVVVLLVAPAGDVVAEDPPVPASEVVAGEQRHHRQTLHRQAEVAPDHRRRAGSPCRRGRAGALDLLVVLELDLEQPDELDGEPGGAGDADAGVLVGREHLLDVALGDDVAHRWRAGRRP